MAWQHRDAFQATVSGMRAARMALVVLAGLGLPASAQVTSPRFFLQADERGERRLVSDPTSLGGFGKILSLDLPAASRGEALTRIGGLSGLRFVYANDLLPAGVVRLVGDTFTVYSALVAVLANADVDVVIPSAGGVVLVKQIAPPPRMQALAGGIHDTATAAPLSGAVVSVLDSARRVLSLFVADSSGRYAVNVPQAATHLKIVRIGYQPRIIALARQRAVRATLDISMARLPTLLSAIAVNNERVCSPDADRAGARSLWEQARAGLLATVAARELKPSESTVFSYERVVEPKTGRVIQQTSRRLSGRSTRPYAAALEPTVLAERGYSATDSAGRRYMAPDADVLLDESFATTHCFSVRDADANHQGAIGLAFEPVRSRDALVDVRGVLWLETAVPSIRALDFQFTGTDSAVTIGPADGVLHFRTMANGVSFVDEWKVRLPVSEADSRPSHLPTELDTYRLGSQQLVPLGKVPAQFSRHASYVSESGGVVVSSEWPDGLRWKMPSAGIGGTVYEEGSQSPAPCALVILVTSGDTVRANEAGHFLLTPVLPGRYRILATNSVPLPSRMATMASDDVEVQTGAVTTVRLELPRNGGMSPVCDGRGTEP